MFRRIIVTTVAIMVLALTGGTRVAPEADALSDKTLRNYSRAYYPALSRCGDKPGPHLRKVPGEPSARRYHLHTKRLQRLCRPQPARVTATPDPTAEAPQAPARAPTKGSSPSVSTGRSAGGYCGAYQFDDATWQSVGGTGSACGASPAEQDRRAQMLLDQRGTSPWPNCGSHDLAAIRQCENGGRY